MSKQVQLTKSEIEACRRARDAIADIGDWANTAEGVDYWLEVSTRLQSMVYHGTSDGKPWVEPEPEIVIDDQWAAVWPRRLVMVRDDECKGWEWPLHLGCVCGIKATYPFMTIEDGPWLFCRPCMPNEIPAYEAANGKQEQPAEPEIGEGYRVATEADNNRRDFEFYCPFELKWHRREELAIGSPLRIGFRYRVPVDRIPTDEDARNRPVVMVRDDDGEPYKPRRLAAATSKDSFFCFEPDSIDIVYWKQCRFPYPGEVSE